MPELLSNIPRNLAWELQTVASQTLVCDQVKSVEDVAVNPEVTVGRVPPSGDAAMPWQSRQREGRPHAKIPLMLVRLLSRRLAQLGARAPTHRRRSSEYAGGGVSRH